jgi:hypothetical protein
VRDTLLNQCYRHAHRHLHGNEHRALFYGFPNSYGTLGYALKVTARTVPVKPYVRIEHVRHTDPKRYFEDLEARCRAKDADFMDGTVFSEKEMFITLGRFADSAHTERLHVRAHLLPLDPREEGDWLSTGISYGAGTPTGSGARRTCSFRTRHPQDRRPRTFELDDLRQGDALEQQVGFHARVLAVGREAPRIRHPGRGHSDRAGPGISRVLHQGGRDSASLDLSYRRLRPQARFPLYPIDPRTYMSISDSGMWWDPVQRD